MKNKTLLLSAAYLTMLFSITQSAYAQPVIDPWTFRLSAVDNQWSSIAHSDSLFVAVAATGTGNRVMTSPDGIDWTTSVSAADNDWYAVTYGAGLFVAVAGSGTGNRVMTSPDGITWTTRTSAANNTWWAVTYGAGLFVAVSVEGSLNSVMTSPDGINWTIRTSATNNAWFSVTYGAGLFVAVAGSGAGNRVMTSPDGITWTTGASAANNQWGAVTYGAGLFVAVATTGAGNRVMTSPDGIAWTIQSSAADNSWNSVTYGAGLFVAVAADSTGPGNRVMTSPDGIAWTNMASAADNQWIAVTYSRGLFVAVAGNGTGNRVMTSGRFIPLPLHWLSITGNLNTAKQPLISWRVTEQNVRSYQIEKSNDGINFRSIGSISSKGDGDNNYAFTELQSITATAYYRIKQTDFDGKFSYSSIVMLRNSSGHPASIYPNPAKGLVTVVVDNNLLNKNAVLTDIDGKLLQTIKITSLSFTINVADYPGGFYLLKIENEKPIKIIKE